MSKESASKDPQGQQPEAFRGLEAAAKAGGVKPPGQTNRAVPETAPQAENLEKQQSEAAGILNRNARSDTKKTP